MKNEDGKDGGMDIFAVGGAFLGGPMRGSPTMAQTRSEWRDPSDFAKR